MDILYLYKDDGLDGESLRYSLRSIDKYGKNIDRVFICGDCPDWCTNVIHIPFTPNKDLFKSKNIWAQILYAVDNSDIGNNHGGEFLISMDDHFYCKETDFNNYPFYVKDYVKRSYRYLLPNFLDYTKMSINYQQILVNTYHLCLNNQLPIYDFVPHRNMHANRYCITAMNNLNGHITDPNTVPVEGICISLNFRMRFWPFKYQVCHDIKNDNIKVLKQAIKEHHVFSINDFELNSPVHKFLQELYPERSKYENEANNNSQTIPEAGSERNTSI